MTVRKSIISIRGSVFVEWPLDFNSSWISILLLEPGSFKYNSHSNKTNSFKYAGWCAQIDSVDSVVGEQGSTGTTSQLNQESGRNEALVTSNYSDTKNEVRVDS